ncbi:MAG: hypothetical protein VKL39_24745 [Leptolyngbyaceae bacterium]|nr:hypothetical protein [Leptolyngbyaceae bacterium]
MSKQAMTTRENFRRFMADRRAYPPGHSEHEILTRTCRKLVWIIRGVPAMNWPAMEEYHDAHQNHAGY